MTKMFFFNKNHGVTPLQNFDVLDFVRTSLFRSKKHSFLSRISKNIPFWVSLLKKTFEKKVDLLTKTMDQPLYKMSIFLDFFRTSLLRSKENFFTSRISKHISFLLSLLKKTYKKKVDFLNKKNHGLTFAKFQFSRLFQNFIFQI